MPPLTSHTHPAPCQPLAAAEVLPPGAQGDTFDVFLSVIPGRLSASEDAVGIQTPPEDLGSLAPKAVGAEAT